jgi:hypothetical protein
MIEQVKDLVRQTIDIRTGKRRSYIIQKYLERPLLIHRRKFDIRCFGLLTSFNGVLAGYFYSEGYLRTSCKEFTTKNITNSFVHLTNDAIQKHAEEYGKFESGNKLSYSEFQRWIDYNGNSKSGSTKPNFKLEILP